MTDGERATEQLRQAQQEAAKGGPVVPVSLPQTQGPPLADTVVGTVAKWKAATAMTIEERLQGLISDLAYDHDIWLPDDLETAILEGVLELLRDAGWNRE